MILWHLTSKNCDLYNGTEPASNHSEMTGTLSNKKGTHGRYQQELELYNWDVS